MTTRIPGQWMKGGIVVAICTMGAIISCSSEPFAPDQIGQIEQLTPRLIQARAGSTSISPTIKLTDRGTGDPIVGASVEFRLYSGAGYFENPVTKTDAAGIATAGNWHVGTRVGEYRMDVVVGELQVSSRLKVLADAPTHFGRVSLTPIGATDETLQGPILTVFDRFDNPVPGIPVDFRVVRGGGALERATFITDEFGVVRAGTWRLGSTPGENAVVASADGVEPVWSTVLGVDAKSFSVLRLAAVRQEAGGALLRPEDVGVGKTTLRITGFDRCLCQIEAGYYIMSGSYTTPVSEEPSRSAGEFKLVPPRLLMPGFKSVAVTADGIELLMQRDDGWTMQWQETWIFR
jgi:hypothetical protein